MQHVTQEQLAQAEQLTRLYALNEAQQAITSALTDSSGTMALLAHYASALSQADGALVQLVEDDHLVVAGSAGTAAHWDGTCLPIAATMAGRVLAARVPLLSNDTADDPAVDVALCRRLGARSLIVAPILAADEALGLLVIFATGAGAFAPTDEQIIGLLAGFAGAALRTAMDHERLAAAETAKSHLLDDLERSQQRFTAAFRSSMIGMAIIRDGVFSEANDSMHAMLRYAPGELIGIRTDEMLPGDQLPALLALRDGLDSRGQHSSEFRVRRGDGSRMWALVSSSLLPDGTSGRCSLLQVIDFGERKERERKLLHRASHDELTGLPNRAQLLDRLSDALAVATDPAEVMVLFCDLDGFKAINDTHGHAAGDAVLAMVAKRLRDLVRTGDLVGRLGGDEFVILPTALDRRGAQALAERARVVLAQPVPWEDHLLQVNASIGIATGRSSAAATLRAADAAMYEEKQRIAG